MRAGQVSLATEGADAVFVTSKSPAMLARRPHRDKEDAYETLAFLGQVHVLVDGPVRSGDLIVASGKADGKGRAVPPEEVQPEDLAMIVGRAWESVDDGSKGRERPRRARRGDRRRRRRTGASGARHRAARGPGSAGASRRTRDEPWPARSPSVACVLLAWLLATILRLVNSSDACHRRRRAASLPGAGAKAAITV